MKEERNVCFVEFRSVVNIFLMPSFGFTNGDVWKCDEVCGIECEYIDHVHSLSRFFISLSKGISTSVPSS